MKCGILTLKYPIEKMTQIIFKKLSMYLCSMCRFGPCFCCMPWVTLGRTTNIALDFGYAVSHIVTHLATSRCWISPYRLERVAKVVIGSLAAKPPRINDVLTGLLMSKGYMYTLLDPCDLRDLAGLSMCVVMQCQRVTIGVRVVVIA